MKDKTIIKESPNGIRFVFYNTKRFKNTRISVRFAVPLSADTACATALVPALLKHSCKVCPSNAQLEKRLASLYGASLSGASEKYGDAQVVSLTVNSIADRFAMYGEKISSDIAELLIQIIFNPDFDESGMFKQENCDREKRLQIEQIQGILNDKITYAMHELQKAMFEGKSYALSAQGTVEGVQSLTPSDITARYRELLESARVQITVIGDVDCSVIERLFTEKFSEYGKRRENIVCDNSYAERGVKEVEEEMALSQGKLCLGFRVGGEDIYANRVMCDMFGGGVYSKLFRVVREKMSLCYYCSAKYMRLKECIFVQSGIENVNRDKAVKGILDQLEALASGDFTEEDFDASVRGLNDIYSGASDTAAEIDIWNSSQILDDNILSIEEYLRGINGVTREDVISAAKKVKLDTVYTLIGNLKEELN